MDSPTYKALFYTFNDHHSDATRKHEVELPDMKSVCHFLFSIDAENFHPKYRHPDRISIKGPVVVYENNNVCALLCLNDEQSKMTSKTGSNNDLVLSFSEPFTTIAEDQGIALNKRAFPPSDTYALLLAQFDKQQECFIYAPGYLTARTESRVLTSESDPNHIVIYSESWTDSKDVFHLKSDYLPNIDDAIKKMCSQDLKRFDPMATGNLEPSDRTEYLYSIRVYSGDLHQEAAELFYINIPDYLLSETEMQSPGVYFAAIDSTFFNVDGRVAKAAGIDLKMLVHYQPEETLQLVGEVKFDRGLHINPDPAWMEPKLASGQRLLSVTDHYRVSIEGEYRSDDKRNYYQYEHHHFFTNPTAALECLLKVNLPSLIPANNHLTDCCYQLKAVSIWQGANCLLRTAGTHDSKHYDEVLLEIFNNNNIGFYELLKDCGLQHQSMIAVCRMNEGMNGVSFSPQYSALSASVYNDVRHLPSPLNTSFSIALPNERQYCVLVGSSAEPIGYFFEKDVTFASAYSSLQKWDELDFTGKKGVRDGFRVSVTDRDGEPLITRLSIRYSDLVPAGVYTMIYSDKITPEVLACIKTDLSIISTQGEQFLCRSTDGTTEHLERKPSPLKPSELLPAPRGKSI